MGPLDKLKLAGGVTLALVFLGLIAYIIYAFKSGGGLFGGGGLLGGGLKAILGKKTVASIGTGIKKAATETKKAFKQVKCCKKILGHKTCSSWPSKCPKGYKRA